MIADESLRNANVIVMGLGRFGGGIAAARWLCEQGANVTVTDLASEERLADSVAALDGLPIRFRLGGHDITDLDACDLLVVSPAVPKDRSDFVAEARRRSIPLSSEMNLFIERCPAQRVIGVTGSAGKSTTTAMIGAVLQAGVGAGCFPASWMGGNIGRSLLASLPEMTADDVVVLELSSFQLEDVASLRWSPSYAVITNLQENHLDRHGTMDAYIDAKMNIVRYQSADSRVFIHHGDEMVARSVQRTNPASRLHQVQYDNAFNPSLQVPGDHNQLNGAMAVAVARTLGVPDDAIHAGLSSFTGLEHRLEFVGELNDVRYFNDSKSTTPESTLIALRAFDAPVVLLVGGGGKGMSFEPFAREAGRRAKAVVCYGEMGSHIFDQMQAAGGSAKAELVLDDFDQVVRIARELADPGDVVVLSPACTSYDMFSNYEQRGDAFRDLVRSFASHSD
jgi:UDP-N-acetylmuramoylalanine--D-glutamate ligase